MRTSKPITVSLGKQRTSLDRRLKSGRYGSASEVLRHALDALDREEALLEEAMREKVRLAIADPRPSVPAADVFRRLRARNRRKAKVASGA